MLEPGSPVVIGVMPGLRPAVVECASEIAELLGGRIYAVYADAGSYSPSEGHLAGVDPDSFGGCSYSFVNRFPPIDPPNRQC